MKFIERLLIKIEKDASFTVLLKIALVLCIFYLLQLTYPVWYGFLHKILMALQPFIYGFAIAFILKGPIQFLRQHKIPKNIAIPFCYLIIVVFVVWLVSSILPIISVRLIQLVKSFIDGINILSHTYQNTVATNSSPWITMIQNGLSSSTVKLQAEVSKYLQTIPSVVTNFLSIFTNSIFTIVISIFMCFSWDKMTASIVRIVRYFAPNRIGQLVEIDEEVSDYIRSLFMIMIIKVIEYCAVYALLGHPDWMILGLLTGVSLIVPYVGPTVANAIGIVTSLTLSIHQTMLLIVIIFVLSNIDEYVITPFVHSKNTKVKPLWALFAIFMGGVLFGIIGIIIAIPVYLVFRILLRQERGEHVTTL